MAQKIRNPSIPIRPATASTLPNPIEPKTQTAAASPARVASSMPARAKLFSRPPLAPTREPQRETHHRRHETRPDQPLVIRCQTPVILGKANPGEFGKKSPRRQAPSSR